MMVEVDGFNDYRIDNDDGGCDDYDDNDHEDEDDHRMCGTIE